jgi:eukaryotic-like serine/threonine-protein kinase
MEAFGKYQVVRRIGAGGMAEVFLARSAAAQGLAKLLVIKKIHPAFARSPHFVRMFVDEAKIALGLNHPNIVQVFDFGQVGPTFFLSMEYLEGVDLLRLMQEGAKVGRRVPYLISAYVVQQMAKGLDYAHRKTDEYGEPLGIVHRDISPQNVLVSWDGAVKITDFGIARAAGVQEEEGVVKGKFAYMSPEQARGEPVDRRSDIYSAGIVLFELACARPLFQGKGKDVLDAVRAGAIPRPRDCDPHLPPALEEIILKALAYHVDDRYQTARDLQHALGRFQFEHAKSSGEMMDSGVLAQFTAQVVPRPKLRASTGELPVVAPPAPAPPVLVPDAAATPVGKRLSPAVAVPVASPPTRPPLPPRQDSRERKQVLVLEGEMTGLAKLRQEVGDARATETVLDFFRIAENVAYKHDAHRYREPGSAPERGGAVRLDDLSRFTYVIGLPVTGEDDASRAIRLALALVDALDGIGRDVEPDLRLAVGIQRGACVVMRRGASWEVELPAATTTFARRLARESQGGEVLVGGGVYRVAKGDWNFEELAIIDLPDEDESGPTSLEDTASLLGRKAKIYRLRGPKEREQRMRERGGILPGELVGRELELKAIRDLHREVLAQRRKHHIILLGEDGIGKRTLVTAFLRSLPAGESMALRAAARAATADTPFSIVADLARDLLGLAEGAEPREIGRRLAATAELLYAGKEKSREVGSLVETMGVLLGLKQQGEEIDADERRTRIAELLSRIQARLSETQPLVVVVEDVHFADSQSWDVFTELIEDRAEIPVLGIATARPDEHILAALERFQNATVIIVDELRPEDRRHLVASRFAPGEDVALLAEQIVARTGGNPLFIRESLEALLERGILAESPTAKGLLTWVRRDAPLQVPTTVEALVATRLDRLPDAEKEVLSRAAVFGRVFSEDDVVSLVGRPVGDTLASLLRRQLVASAPQPGSWTFRNEMTPAVAYDLIPADERQRLHRRAAERIGGAPGYRSGQDDALVARHLELSGDTTSAAERYLAAAMHARDVRGNVEAFRHLSRAIELLPAPSHAVRFDARAEREAILRAWAQRPQQLRELHLMRREADALGDEAKQVEVATRLGQFYIDVGKGSAAEKVLAPALEAARKLGAPLAEAQIVRLQAVIARTAGRYPEALDLCGKALALCGEDRGGLAERAQILSIRGSTLWYMARLREALEAHAEALVIHRKLRVPRQEARALNNMGIVFWALGEFEEALAHYKRALKIDQDLGDRAQIALKLANLGEVYVGVGDPQRAEQYLGKALAIAEQLRDQTTETDAVITLGSAHLKRGDAAAAKVRLDRGLELARQIGSRYQETRALLFGGMARLRLGERPADALELFRQGTRLAHAAPLPALEALGLAYEGLALEALGERVAAFERSTTAVERMSSARTPEAVDEICWIHARLARAIGRHDVAKEAIDRAHKDILGKARRIKDAQVRERYLGSSPAKEIARESSET